MQNAFNAATTGISEVFTQLKTDAQTVSESVKQLLGEQEKQTAQVTEVTRLAENTRNALVDGTQQIQNAFNAATTEISDEISGVSTQLQAKTAAVSKNVEDLLTEQKTALELLLEGQTQQIKEVSGLTKNTGAALVGGTQQMQNAFNAATTEISKVSTQLKTDAQTVSESVKQLLREQEKQTEAVRSLGTGLKTNLEDITELLAGNGISAAINSIDTSITDCSEQLEKAAKTLAKVNTQLDATSEGRN